MKCKKCKFNNIIKADYCKKCGNTFSAKDKKIAKSRTIPGLLEELENAYKVCTLKVITDHILFKIFSVLIILALGIHMFFSYGSELKFLEGNNYKIEYNKNTNEYYFLTEDENIALELYVPFLAKDLEIKKRNTNEDDVLEEINCNDDEEIVLSLNKKEEYYELTYKSLNKEKALKIYVLKENNNGQK